MNTFTQKMLVAAGIGVAGALAGRGLLRRLRWFEFAGKTVLIAGGSRGLGLVLARELVDRGARVAICARTSSTLERAAAELRERGGAVLAEPCDIRDADQVQKFVQKVIDRWGSIDVLINVAGIIQVGPFDAMTPEDFHEAMDINCWGPLNVIQAVLPAMRRQRWGRIVNVASIGGKRAVPHLLPYVVSKFALVGLSNGLRVELARENILVTTVCPSLMRTGSPLHAIFKGQHRLEYAWFSIGDSLPIVSISAEQAAQQILMACQRGDSEVIVNNPLNLVIYLQQLVPKLAHEVLAQINRLLPEMGGIGQQAARGFESQSRWSPSWLTRLSDQAALRNNEL